MTGWAAFGTFRRDVRYGARLIRRSPAFSATVILTLALVIGATTAVFSLADAILVRTLPYPSPERLATVAPHAKSARGESTGASVNGATWEIVRDHATKIDAAPYMEGTSGVNFVSGNTASFVQQQRVGAGFFRVLGVSPMIGREFTREEDVSGGPAVAIVAHDFWRRALGGRPDAIGQRILLRGQPYDVVGVMPAGFLGPAHAEVWTPMRPSRTGEGSGSNYHVVARLKGDETWVSASGELGAFSDDLLGNSADSQTRRSLVLVPFQDSLNETARQPLVLLSSSVFAVLLVACVNIAALLLARGGSRSSEIATRLALGATRSVVVRQLMTESVLLALVGGALGLALGYAGLEGLKMLGGSTYGQWTTVVLDGRAVAITAGVSILTSLVFGLVPAFQAGRTDVNVALVAAGSRSVAGSSRHWLRRALVVIEVATSVVLLVSAGLLMREFAALRSLQPGFVPDDLYTASVSIQDARYPDSAAANRLIDGSIDALRHTPGISAAAVSQKLPYENLLNVPFQVEGRPASSNGRATLTNIAYVTPEFFSTFSIPILQGRAINENDRRGAPEAVVINETFARIYFKDEPALGRRLDLRAFAGIASAEIVGIASNVLQLTPGFSVPGLQNGPIVTPPAIYTPAAQTGDGLFRWFAPTWTVRASSAREAGSALQQAIASVDPLLPVGQVRSMTEVASRATARQRLLMTLVGVLAAAALLLAAIGVHGLIAHAVAERTREFGIRLALGATAAQTMGAVAMSGLVLAAIGATVGAALSIPASHLVEASLSAVSTRDATTYGGVALLLFGVATLSSVLPALRIFRLDLAKTLRE